MVYRMRWLIFFYPFLELWSLIWLGTETRAVFALCWVLGAMILGGAMIRWAGRNSLQRLAQANQRGQLAQRLMVTDVAVIFCGLLLIVPGLISDAVALLLLLKPVRSLIASRWRHRPKDWQTETAASTNPDIIEGEFTVSGSDEPLGTVLPHHTKNRPE